MTDEVATIAAGLTRPQVKLMLSHTDGEKRRYGFGESRVRVNLFAKKLLKLGGWAGTHMRQEPLSILTPLGEQVRRHLQAEAK